MSGWSAATSTLPESMPQPSAARTWTWFGWWPAASQVTLIRIGTGLDQLIWIFVGCGTSYASELGVAVLLAVLLAVIPGTVVRLTRRRALRPWARDLGPCVAASDRVTLEAMG
jgi:hypothetical protein